jgi:predicted membrane protein
MHHIGNASGNDRICILFFCGSIVATNPKVVLMIGVASGWLQVLIPYFQVTALLGSIVASVLVSIDHHKKISWKRKQEKKDDQH